MPLGSSFLEDVPSVELMCLVFMCMPGGVTVSDLGLCCCVPYLFNTVNSLCLMIVYICMCVCVCECVRVCVKIQKKSLPFMRLINIFSTISVIPQP